jgi:hypothetical protein
MTYGEGLQAGYIVKESDVANRPVESTTTGPVDEASLPMLQRIVVSALGIACLVTGAVATFVTSNGAGSAALLAGGLGLVVLAFLGNRLDLLKFGSFEAHLRKANTLLRQADELEVHGRTDEADALRAQADRLLLEVAPHARGFEQLRRMEPAGPERTRHQYDTVHKAEQYARDHRPTPDAVLTVFNKGEDGDRIYALGMMKADPSVAHFDAILDAIEHSRSAFEQYQALELAEQILPQLDGATLDLLEAALLDQTAPRGWIDETTDRWSRAQRMLAAIRQR